MSLSNIAPRGVWGVGRRAHATSAGAPQTRQPPMCHPRHPASHPSISIFSISLVPFLVTQSLWSPTATTPSPCPSIPRSGSRFLDHPNSKLWAGGQGTPSTTQARDPAPHNPSDRATNSGGGPVAQPAPDTTPPTTGSATAPQHPQKPRAPEEGARFSVGWGGVAADRSEGHRAFLDDAAWAGARRVASAETGPGASRSTRDLAPWGPWQRNRSTSSCM